MDADICKQSYGDVVEFTARLAALSTSRFEKIGHGHYETRATELASRDLIFLAISLRRLVETTHSYALVKNLMIPTFSNHKTEQGQEVNDAAPQDKLWEIIGKIIHSRTISIFKDDAQLRIYLSTERFEAYDLFTLINNRQSIEAVVYLKSDRGSGVLFLLSTFLREIVDLTDKLDDVLTDNKIYVGVGFE